MMNKLTNFALATVSTLSLTALVACDGSDPNRTSSEFLAARYDVTALEANATDIARMPSNLISSDLITYTPTAEDFTQHNVTLPRTSNENDWQLSPNTAGEMIIERQRYFYTGSDIRLSTLDVPDGPEFDRVMLSLANTGGGREGSLSSLLTTEKYPINSAEIFQLTEEERTAIQDAVFSLGYVAVNMPAAEAVGRGNQDVNGVDTAQVDVDNIVLFRDRRFTHTVTSTNQEILDSNEIRGTFTVTDTYYDLALEANANDLFYHVIIARNPTFSQTLQTQGITPQASGTFVLQLGNIDSTNPAR